MKNSLGTIKSIGTLLCWFMNKNASQATTSYLHIQLTLMEHYRHFQQRKQETFKGRNKTHLRQVSFAPKNPNKTCKKVQNLAMKALSIELWITRKTSKWHKSVTRFVWCFQHISLIWSIQNHLQHQNLWPALKIICISWLTPYCLIRDKVLSSFQLAQKYQGSTLPFLCAK